MKNHLHQKKHVLVMYMMLTAFFAPLGLIFGIPLIGSNDESASKTGAFVLSAAIICTLLSALIYIFLPDIDIQIGLIGTILFANFIVNMVFAQEIPYEKILSEHINNGSENKIDDDAWDENEKDNVIDDDSSENWEQIGGDDE